LGNGEKKSVAVHSLEERGCGLRRYLFVRESSLRSSPDAVSFLDIESKRSRERLPKAAMQRGGLAKSIERMEKEARTLISTVEVTDVAFRLLFHLPPLLR
jgi:hypothetical protein